MRAHAHSHDELRAKEKIFSSTAATSVWQSRDREMDVLRIRIKKLKCDPFKLLKRRS